MPPLICSGTWQPTGFALPCLRWLYFIHFSARWIVPELHDDDITYETVGISKDFRGREKVRPTRRGYAPYLQRRFVIRDWLWLSQLTIDYPISGKNKLFTLPV